MKSALRERGLGLSFSLHRCYELQLDPKALLSAAHEELGCQWFRLMSYWDIHEPDPGHYNFTELDWQMEMAADYQASISLCLGMRQPRWPEFHIPKWAEQLSAADRYQALYAFNETVIKRYRRHPALDSWQLENEALLKSFGSSPVADFNRKRLRHEYRLLKALDPTRPAIMTLSDSWGLPWLGPIPDYYAMSLYRLTINQRGRYVYSRRPPLFYKVRGFLIRLLRQRPVFIHELQAEPWVNRAIADVPLAEQLEYMNAQQLQSNVLFAQQTGLQPISLWGLEWWYWLKVKQGEESLWQAAKEIFSA